MLISAYQVNNVLRVYGDQLRQSSISNRPRSSDAGSPDKISISENARRKTIIDNIILELNHILQKENLISKLISTVEEKEVYVDDLEKLLKKKGKKIDKFACRIDFCLKNIFALA